MPEYFRALIIIVILATATFAFAHQSACDISGKANFTRRRNLWFALTLAAFLSHGFWIFVAIAFLLLNYTKRHEYNIPALYFFILFVIPEDLVAVPGMGLVSFVIDLNYARMLALAVLLPAYLFLRKQSDTPSFGRTGPDKVLIAYLTLTAILFFRPEGADYTLANSFRQVFYLSIDIFLPYFVISRSVKNIQSFRDALLSLVLAIMVLAPMAFFEFAKSWLLYQSMSGELEMAGGLTGYLGRDGMTRALASAGQPIPLGYLMVVGLGLYFFIQNSIQNKFVRRLGWLVLTAGLIAPLSRGPWIGSVALLFVFIATGRYAFRRLMSLALAAILVLPLVSVLPGGERVINLLPFIGTTEKSNVDYRERLITNSMIVIDRNPWFGSPTFYEAPEMEQMRQGQGIIDIVNTYVGETLYKGYIGLSLFVSIFAFTLSGVYQAMRSISDRDCEEYLLGRTLLATQIAIMVIIFTVSSITVIPIVYWAVVGLGVAYAQMVRKNAAG
jgi:hypothetical protein